MSLILKLAGMISVALGILLCLPAGGVALATIAHPQHDLGGVSLSGAGVGGLSFTGRQAWMFLGGSAAVGLLFILLGIYVLFSSRSES